MARIWLRIDISSFARGAERALRLPKWLLPDASVSSGGKAQAVGLVPYGWGSWSRFIFATCESPKRRVLRGRRTSGQAIILDQGSSTKRASYLKLIQKVLEEDDLLTDSKSGLTGQGQSECRAKAITSAVI